MLCATITRLSVFGSLINTQLGFYSRSRAEVIGLSLCVKHSSNARSVQASLLFCLPCLLIFGWLWAVAFRSRFDTLRVSICQMLLVAPSQDGKFHQLFHHINNSKLIRRWPHLSFSIKFSPCHWDRRLIWNRYHPHPPSKKAHLIYRIKALRASTNLHNRQSFSLRWPDTAA